ncbi:kinase-like domain-containing protein [Pilaira anomala]|nr:kinase-like domain-containing protein [Pilaira anomala]
MKYKNCSPNTADKKKASKTMRRLKSMGSVPVYKINRKEMDIFRNRVVQPKYKPKVLSFVNGLPKLEVAKDAWGFLYRTGDDVLTLDKSPNGDLLPHQNRGYIIGSDDACDFKVISSSDAPKRHAHIYASPRIKGNDHRFAVFIQDLSLKVGEGIWVNKKSIGKNVHELDTKDLIHFRDPNVFKGIENPVYTFIKPNKSNLLLASFPDLYSRIRVIGSGSYGTVLLAVNKETGERVAIKEVVMSKKDEGVNTKRRATLFREISVCMALPSHPCIIQTDKVFEENNTIYLIMEYGFHGDLFTNVAEMEGPSLREYEIKIIFEQVAHAIAYLHEHGIVHRDIKMENIIICDRKKLVAKLCDFGLSTFAKAGESLFSNCGTIMYAAPEVLRSSQPNYEGYGMEVDVWSLGVLLYSSLSNSMPFFQMQKDSEANKKLLRSHILKGEFQFNHPAWEEISDDAKDLIRHMMEMDVRKRYTMDEVLAHPWLQDVENEQTRELGICRTPEMTEYLEKRMNSRSPSL